MLKNKAIWLITGVSGGLGRSLAMFAAGKGHTVYGTLRNKEQITDFEALVPGKTLGVLMDVRNHSESEAVVADIIEKKGGIDVLVNNAGFGMIGAIEELTDQEIRNQFETNFFGALFLTQKVLPIMRQQKDGKIVQISSAAGFRATAGFGIYNASKFALEGFSEALAQETKPLGIDVMIVEPGPFRTQFAGTSAIFSKNTIADYDETAGSFKRLLMERSGQQDGDPEKAAKVIYDVLYSNNPPLRLPLGMPSITAIRSKLAQVESDITAWEHISAHTSY